MTHEFNPRWERNGHLLVFIFLVSVTLSMPVTRAQIIVDRSSVSEFDQIPQDSIDAVKNMLLNHPGESHNRGMVYGIENLEQHDSRFAVNPGVNKG